MGYMKSQGVRKIMGRGPSPRGGGFAVTSWFFDSPKVMNAVDKATRRVLSRFGSYVRRTMKTSIRKRKSESKPGKPPSSHVGLLKQFIYFAYDPRAQSVVIGPERLNAKTGDVPHTLEYGGSMTLKKDTVVRVGGPGRDKRGRFVLGQRKKLSKGTRLVYKARPFARPALQKEQPKLAGMWKASVKA